MKIINPGVEYIPQTDNTLKGIYKQIEKAGRTCYKSEDKITEDSAEAFVQRMIESNHYAMLEHGTVYLRLEINRTNGEKVVKYPWYFNNEEVKFKYVFAHVQSLFKFNPYSRIHMYHDPITQTSNLYITTNFRVIVENNWQDIMNEFISEQTGDHIPRITLKFTTNIGVTREGNRMRANSIAEESTRYCNYTKEKFGSELNIVPPVWLDKYIVKEILPERTTEDWISEINSICIHEMSANTSQDLLPSDYYGAAIAFSNICYNNLIRLGWKPQQAREVLPLATKSDVVYTAFPNQWRHFFDLRLFGKTGTPHPNMQSIASLARDILCEKDLWYLIYRPDEPEFSAHQVEGDATTKQD